MGIIVLLVEHLMTWLYKMWKKKCPQIQSTPGGQTNVNGFDFCKNNNQALA